MDIETIKQQTYDLIDRLKKTTVDNGLAGGGNEYTVIIETFLYKFLNDKFIYEAKKVRPELIQTEDFFAALDALPEDDYEMHSRQGTISSRPSSNILSRTTMPTEEETMQSIIHLTPSHPLWRSCL